MQAYCFVCEKTVTAHAIKSEKDFWSAIDSDGDVEVMHPSEGGDHQWKLNRQEKENLRNTRAKGLI
jgi:hypothetical protein